jgi:hypothetical protein
MGLEDGNMRNAQEIMRNQIAESLGLARYGKIMRTVGRVDVSADENFQRLFNGYYQIRRNSEWRGEYYRLFQRLKGAHPTFESILAELYRTSKNIEASFSSKMLATLEPDRPIWDQFVIQSLRMNLKERNREETLQNVVRVYADIEAWYGRFLRTDRAAACVEVFDQALPDYAWVSRVKKVDFFLWSSRGNSPETFDC